MECWFKKRALNFQIFSRDLFSESDEKRGFFHYSITPIIQYSVNRQMPVNQIPSGVNQSRALWTRIFTVNLSYQSSHHFQILKHSPELMRRAEANLPLENIPDLGYNSGTAGAPKGMTPSHCDSPTRN